jgi:hypothetical protein
MFLFPLAYIVAFLKTIKEFAKGNAAAILIFICVGLPIYINTLSVTYMFGFENAIGPMQAFKEIVVLIALGIVLWQIKHKPTFTKTDWLVILFFLYSLAFVLLPIGSYDFKSRLLAYKSLSFFTLLYFIGRFIDAKKIRLATVLKIVGVVTMIAALVLLYEFIQDKHLHTQTGYIDFLVHFFDDEPSGNYGLTWSFETETGLKRFGSIFGNPLELGASILLSLSLVLAFYTNTSNKLKLSKLGSFIFTASLVCIFFALSRASFIGNLLLIIVYAFIVKNRWLIRLLYLLLTLIVLAFIYLVTQKDIYNFVLETITFSNASSIGHVLEWLNGIEAMIAKPLGMGLGESGRISMFAKENTGGENQFIITGVQVGIPMLILYLSIHISLMVTAYKNLKSSVGKIKRIAMTLFLFKIGIIIPMFTSNTESFIYISYITWFLSGLMINLIEQEKMAKLEK